jgi:hypothetical protein
MELDQDQEAQERDADNENEQAEDVDDEVDLEVEVDSDLQPAHRAEALDVLATIELKFALLRERVYVEKMEGLAWEEVLVGDGMCFSFSRCHFLCGVGSMSVSNSLFCPCGGM